MNKIQVSFFTTIRILVLILLELQCCLSLEESNHLESLKDELKKSRQHDSGPTSLEIIKSRGFIGELYSIPSLDGQPISIHHIINPLANQSTLNRYPVLLFHGLTGDSTQLISHSERQHSRAPNVGNVFADSTDTSLPFLLSNNNFDVFIIDARGTSLNNHLVSKDLNLFEGSKYWNFSLDEQIQFDLPAGLEFVLKQTHAEKLHYVGYSESTLFMFALLSVRPEYSDKLVSFVALSPVCYVSKIQGALKYLIPLLSFVPDSINANLIPQPIADTMITFLKRVCQIKSSSNLGCLSLVDIGSGYGDTSYSRGFYSTALKSTSLKALKHFIQIHESNRFKMYDYGEAGNLRQYGTKRAPAYDLSKVHLKTLVIVRGERDFLSTPRDQRRLLDELGMKPYKDISLPGYNHLDFIMGKSLVRDVYYPVTEIMFNLLKEAAFKENNRSMDILMDPKRALMPRPYKPVGEKIPDGLTNLTIKSNFFGNLIEGIKGIKLFSWAG